MVGESLHEPELVVVEGGAVELVDHLDDAVEGVVMHHGDAEHAPRDEARLARHVGIVARIAARVVEADGLAVDRHPAGDALADRESYTVDHPVAKRTRDAEGELAPLLIVDDERRVLGRHRRGQAGEDRVQRIGLVCDAFEVRPRRELGRDGGGAPAVVLVERAAVVAALEVDRPENALLPAHRHDEPLGAHEAAHGRRQRGLAAGEGVLLERLGGCEDELVALAVVEEEREALGGGELLDRVEDGVQDRGQLERRGERAERAVDGRQLGELVLESHA